ncbi:hypothetical protein [Pelagicoccus sp. SDUM812002]|uniref:hypothetical protein n=1 Tax=Pelagicoccus sp. SDUM812002 TaxID=3041266 RepID=UPI00281057A2|nr:hypothetical protein [Pelagicoccus sp. SDUM812002]MDQ8187993.1 hypothetical protein [Pelagicoccus sp. SDUM812002]
MTKKHIVTAALAALTAAQASFASEVTFGGFLSNGYIKSSANNYLVDSEEGDFDFAEVGINANWSPFDRATVRGQLFAFEVGNYGNFDPKIDYLFFDYNVVPSFGLRVGRVKRAEGIYTDIQDIDVARTSVLLPIGMYDPRYRDFTASVDGGSIYGNFQIGNHSFEYTAFHGDIDSNPNSGIAAYALTKIGASLENATLTKFEAQTDTGAQLWWYTPISGLRFGAAHSSLDTFNIVVSAQIPYLGYPIQSETLASSKNTTFSSEYFVGDWTFVAEYRETEIKSRNLTTIAGMTEGWGPEARSKGYSWYLSASRRFLEKFEAGATIAEWVENEETNSLPSEIQNDRQFSLRYNATDYWTLKAEFHLLEGTNRLFNQLGQNQGPLDSKWNMIATKSTFSF